MGTAASVWCAMIDQRPLLSAQGSSWAECTVTVLRMAVPNAFRMILTLSNEVVNVVMLARMTSDPSVLAAVGLGNMMQNVFALSIGLGLISAFDTLVSQAYGAGNHQDTVITLERGRLIALSQFIWIAPVLCFTEDILVGLGQDPTVAAEAGSYNRAALLGLPGIFMGEAYRSFLTNRSHVVAPTIISAITSVLHIVWCWYFVLWCRLGNFGAGLANAVTWTLGFLLTLSYALYASRREGLKPWHLMRITRKAFGGWTAYLSIGLPAMLQMCGEWWFWELCALVVGYLGKVPLAAHVSAMSYVAVVFMPSIGVASSCATLVGQAIGRQSERDARRTIVVSLVSGFVVVMALSAVTLIFVRPIAGIYSQDPSTQSVIVQVLKIYYPLVFMLDAVQNICGAALRGLGLQVVAGKVYLVCFYGIMLPVGCAFAFWLGGGVAGIWYGMAVGLLPADMLFLWIIHRTDYQEQMRAAIDRADVVESSGVAKSNSITPSGVIRSCPLSRTSSPLSGTPMADEPSPDAAGA